MEKTPPISGALGPNDWIMAGFQALAIGGPGALRAEALARDIGTTKGSFYWHFKDLRDFQAQMLEMWQAQAPDSLSGPDLPRPTSAKERAQQMVDWLTLRPVAPLGDPRVEPALRAWALAEPWVAERLAVVDDQRLTQITHMFTAAGLGNGAAKAAALTLYGLWIGLQSLLIDRMPEAQKLLRKEVKRLLSQG